MWRHTPHNVLLLPLLQILLNSSVEGRFYIGRYKTVPSQKTKDIEGRSMPYIVYADEEGNMSGNYGSGYKNRRIERPPMPPSPYNSNQRWDIDPPTLYGPASFYANNPSGYSVVSHKDVEYVVPPFTPGGRVNVAFQFWIPISIGGFFVNGRDLEKAFKSKNPTAYISSLFLKHLSTNTTASDLLGELSSPMLEKSVQSFLDWVVPYLGYFTGSDINVVDESPLLEAKNMIRSRKKRDLENDINGWVTIGGSQNTNIGSEDVLDTEGSADPSQPPGQSQRLLWTEEQLLSGNNIVIQDSKRRPELDFGTSAYDSYDEYLRPFSSRPTTTSSSSRPTLSYNPTSLPTYPSSLDSRPPFHLASFDDLPSGTTKGSNRGLDVSMRLSRLDYFFSNLHLDHEECRRRVLCEVARDPDTFSPLSDVINGETRIPGDFRELSRELLNTAEGARLLSYIEAVKLGEDKSRQCDVYRYRCRTKAREIINTDILPIWREVVRWLTVKVLTQDTNAI